MRNCYPGPSPHFSAILSLALPQLARLSCFLIGLLSLVVSGCVSPKQVVYFQAETSQEDSLTMIPPYVPLIQPGDVLAIQVSSLNPEASVMFNPYLVAGAGGNSAQAGAAVPTAVGYSVSPAGQVEIPLLGSVAVAGLSIAQAGELIRDKLKTYLKEPTVNVQNQSFRISVLGEVVRPALYTIPNNNITLIEALSLAGDATIFGRRDNVMVIRESQGKKQFAHINLTRRDVFRSPYYHLHPNDVVYVEPGKARVTSSDRTFQIVPIVLSALSILAIIITRF